MITFGFVKSDAYENRKQILEEFISPSGLVVVGQKDPYYFTEEIAREHYKALEDKPFFNQLIDFTLYGLSGVSSRYGERRIGSTALYVLEGKDAIRLLRRITGDTNPGIAKFKAHESKMETIRSKHGIGMPNNAFHSADSRQTARREIELHFKREELPEYVWKILKTYPMYL